MSMILLSEAATTILLLAQVNQAADHLIKRRTISLVGLRSLICESGWKSLLVSLGL
jgi:hypothetical protein